MQLLVHGRRGLKDPRKQADSLVCAEVLQVSMARLRGKPYRLALETSRFPGERVSSEIISSDRPSMRVWGQRPGQPKGL